MRLKIFPLADLDISETNSTPPRSFLWGATWAETTTKKNIRIMRAIDACISYWVDFCIRRFVLLVTVKYNRKYVYRPQSLQFPTQWFWHSALGRHRPWVVLQLQCPVHRWRQHLRGQGVWVRWPRAQPEVPAEMMRRLMRLLWLCCLVGVSSKLSLLFFITRVASWGPDRRKWLFSEFRCGTCADKYLCR